MVVPVPTRFLDRSFCRDVTGIGQEVEREADPLSTQRRAASTSICDHKIVYSLRIPISDNPRAEPGAMEYNSLGLRTPRSNIMSPYVPEELFARSIDWSPFAITMPPRDPDEDEEDEDEDEEDEDDRAD